MNYFGKIIFVLWFLGSICSSAYGAEHCGPGAIDPDNDGWGWENGASCVVVPVCTAAAIDPDFDGWGWENNATCLVSGSTLTPGTSVETAADLPLDTSITLPAPKRFESYFYQFELAAQSSVSVLLDHANEDFFPTMSLLDDSGSSIVSSENILSRCLQPGTYRLEVRVFSYALSDPKYHTMGVFTDGENCAAAVVELEDSDAKWHVADDGSIFVFRDNRIQKLDGTGTINWESSVQFDELRDLLMLDDGSVLVLSNGISYLNAQGNPVWGPHELIDGFNKLYASSDLVLVRRFDEINALNIKNSGAFEWSYTIKGGASNLVVTDDGRIILEREDGVTVLEVNEL